MVVPTQAGVKLSVDNYCAGTAISQEQGSHIATGLAAAAVLLVLAVVLSALQGLHASCQQSPGSYSLPDPVTTPKTRLGALHGISMHKGNRYQPPQAQPALHHGI